MKWDKRKLIVGQVKQRYKIVEPYLTERAKRVWAVSEALSVGYGGVTIVCEATGISGATINKGMQELDAGLFMDCKQVRREGGGRKKLIEHDPKLLEDLDELIDPCTRGDPQSPLRWTCKSTYKIADALQEKGHTISQSSVYALLVDLHYSLQSNRKTREGGGHVDRDAQFQHINAQVKSLVSLN